MRLTKSKLKQLIKEELETFKEVGYTHPDHPDVVVDPDTFKYAEEMETIVQNLQGLRRDIGWNLNNNRNLTVGREDLIADVNRAITKREKKIIAALSDLVGKIAAEPSKY